MNNLSDAFKQLDCLNEDTFEVTPEGIEELQVFKDEDNIDDVVDIIDIKDNGNTKTYNVSSKGWGVIKASIEVSDDKIISILITDSSSETQWNEIEKVNYLDDLIKNQDDIDSLDAVSGSTRTSNGLKNMIKKVKGDINEK